jgi:murein DD-endopeptidase MepM/ murein hydrolase activator NlpD
MTTATAYNAAQIAAGKLTADHVTELVRYWQAGHQPLVVDGQAGPLTIASIAVSSAATGKPIPFLACPLPVLPDGRRAVITSGFRPADRPNHDGCDWFYAWRAGDKPDFVGDHGAAGPASSPRWVVPLGVNAIAAAPGVVTMAGASPTGHRVWIDHRNGWRTGYFHLLDLRVKVGDEVATGAPLGMVGDNPADDDGRHLHFELSAVDRYAPVDPEPYLVRG